MMPIEPDHYGTLELAPGSPMEEVKAQYRRLAKRYHPDVRGNGAASQEKFRRINAAYTFLSDAPRKAAYDDVLKAARRMGAPPLKAVPPAPKAPSPTATGYHASPTATGYHASPTATGYHAPPPPDKVRMTRSAWLGATAGAIVVVVVIGFSLNSSVPSRPTDFDAPALAPIGSASGGGDMPGADAGTDSAMDPPFTPAPLSALRVPPNAPRPHASSVPTPHAVGKVSADAQRQRLLTRPHAAPPYAAPPYAAPPRAEAPHTDRVLRERLAVDLKKLSAARARVRPAPRLTAHATPAEQHREAAPIQRDLRRAEDARSSVRDDLKALSAEAAPVKAAPVKAPPPVVAREAPAPAPFISAPASPPPAPPQKAEAKQAAKVKAPAGQEFIMWGK